MCLYSSPLKNDYIIPNTTYENQHTTAQRIEKITNPDFIVQTSGQPYITVVYTTPGIRPNNHAEPYTYVVLGHDYHRPHSHYKYPHELYIQYTNDKNVYDYWREQYYATNDEFYDLDY